ncbi:MAG: FAD binding domain-containing protein [Alphaproteobacteria bacterium]|uniref:FAD binding domain-containing protein n=1 Tax=Aurantimonas sp. 22II-16-19i TaxID=1317114 RepID=UPI0009F7A8AB|nr:FAD binding domain-containing protein [Aurantimonas sp. 22II-16-19i]MBU1258485.1 FAD binding domain-containing protein [Alphaproteobacteria bacterium]ORE91850.1 FAD-binding molybdopterin dehydrogenase protein [Aurantimonas sp. 22II-16-19i]
MLTATSPSVVTPTSIAEALAALSGAGRGAAPLAGGTWIMRSPLRREALAPAYVALGRIPELAVIAVAGNTIEIGAAVTHADLAGALAAHPEFAALRAAAGNSANPAVRSAATLGGNLCAPGFAAADLVPALLCLDATVEIAGLSGSERMSVAEFLARRVDLRPGMLLTKVILQRSLRRSVHVRLPLRKAGDYPVAIVSMAVGIDDRGCIALPRIAVGSVEATARRWTALEDALAGQTLDPARASAIARSLTAGFSGREGVEAPGWYRVQVLPALVGRAVAALASQA